MRAKDLLGVGLPSCLLVAAGVAVGAPTIDGTADSDYGASLSEQISSVISIFSDPFALSLDVDETPGVGVDELVASNFKSDPATVTTGFEIGIDLTAIGYQGSGDITVVMFVNGSGVDFLSNQVAGGLPAGTGNLGDPALVDFSSIPGEQYVTFTAGPSNASITIDGELDAAYPAPEWVNGDPLSPGTENPTGFADNNDPTVETANGSELNAVRGFIDVGANTLYVHAAGNIETNFNKISMLIDSRPGGENVLSGVPAFAFGGLDRMTGLQFDTSPLLVEPDFYIQYGADAGSQFVDFAEVGVAGAVGNAGGARASNDPIVGTFANPPFSFTGGFEVDVDNSNVLGIAGPGGGDGVDQPFLSDPALVSTGVEFSIDLNALGYTPGDDIGIAALLSDGDQVSNQVTGGLPANTGPLGPGDGIDFTSFAGDQFVTFTPSAITTAPTIDGTADGSYVQLYANDASGTGNSTSLGAGEITTDVNDDPVVPPVSVPGSKIDNLSAVVVDNGGGDFDLYVHVGGAVNQFHDLAVFFDVKPGGQNVIREDVPGNANGYFTNFAGLIFDAGFEPDFAIVYNKGAEVDGTGAVVESNFVDGTELLTLGAGDPTAPASGGFFGGGLLADNPIVGDLVSRTGFGNNDDPSAEEANGSELDSFRAFYDLDFVYFIWSGNLETNFTKFDIFIDVIDEETPGSGIGGGQNTLVYDGDPVEIEDPNNPGQFIPNPNYTGNPDIDFNALNRMGGPFPDAVDPTNPGLTFDAGFSPDYYIFVTAGDVGGTIAGEPEISMGIARLRNALYEDPDNFGQTPRVEDPGNATFYGTTRPFDNGVIPGTTARVNIDNSNILGVSGGPDPFQPDDSAPSSVTTGIEIRIPIDDIIVPPGQGFNVGDAEFDLLDTLVANIKIQAFINGGDHGFVSNQSLPPICAFELGEVRDVNFETDHPGLQFADLSPNPDGTYTNSSPAPPACVPTGACCLGESCMVMTPADCDAQNGFYLGDLTTCGDTPADNPCVGACCSSANPCFETAPEFCTGPDETFLGRGTDCADCPVTTGACCFSCNGSTQEPCIETTQSACEAAQGVFQGDGTTCAGVNNCDDVCPGDVNGDGATDVSDFFALGGNFGTASGALRADGDLNCDGAVDVSDFFILGGDFGCTP